jgi:nucleotide-binding universal stress UspA family protein
MSEILVGFDGSPGADDALTFATTMARAAAATVRLVHAYPYDDTRTRASNEAYRDYLQQDAAAVLAAADESVRDVATAIEPIADVSPARALHTTAERSGAALIVVGSTHRGSRPSPARQHRRATAARRAVCGRDRAMRLREALRRHRERRPRLRRV